jgi:hypothetical protein
MFLKEGHTQGFLLSIFSRLHKRGTHLHRYQTQGASDYIGRGVHVKGNPAFSFKKSPLGITAQP